MKINFKKASGIFFVVCSTSIFAQDRIEITVVAPGKAMAVGYKVEGKKAGGLGRTYSGIGPVNKEYFFGYRKNALSGEDIPCGSVVLSKNSKVKLITKDSQCSMLIN